MLHDTDDVDIFTITDGIGLCFNGIFQEMVKQDPVPRNILQYVDDMFFELLLIDHDLHALSTQYVRRANE